MKTAIGAPRPQSEMQVWLWLRWMARVTEMFEGIGVPVDFRRVRISGFTQSARVAYVDFSIFWNNQSRSDYSAAFFKELPTQIVFPLQFRKEQ